jgi:hypothetical protein
MSLTCRDPTVIMKRYEGLSKVKTGLAHIFCILRTVDKCSIEKFAGSIHPVTSRETCLRSLLQMFALLAAEPVKGQSDLGRASVRPFSSGEGMKIPVLALAATKAAGSHIAKSKFDLKSNTVGKESPNYNTSKTKTVSEIQRNFRKIVPSKGAPQPQTSIKPRLSETAVVDETTNIPLAVSIILPVLYKYFLPFTFYVFAS